MSMERKDAMEEKNYDEAEKLCLEKANAENTMKQIEELGYKSSMYQDQEYVVITDIFIKQKDAHQQAKEIAEKGNTCVVKEYFIDDSYQEKIEKKEYNAIYQFLKTN